MIPIDASGTHPDSHFLDVSASKLRDDFFPRLEKATTHLTDAEVWSRSNDRSNAVGNILLHMAGNLRQWVISGVGGETDVRRRSDEFEARGGQGRSALLDHVRRTVDESVAVIRHVSSDDLMRKRTVQGFKVTGLEAIYHAVEHFSYHTGQVIVIVKALKSVDLKFYDL